MPTQAEITAADSTLDELAQAQLLALIRGSNRYKSNPGFYVLPAAAIEAASGTVKGKQLNAALTLIDEVGDGTVALTGGEDAIDFDQDRDREQLIDYCISVLYESPIRREIRTTSATNETTF
jgi:hypothetical protein